MTMNLKKIENIIDEYLDEIIEFRRDIHSNPELGNSEFETSRKILEKLQKFPLDIDIFSNNIGISACLNKENKNKTILFRCDMDALPMTEETNLEYASKVKNVMHSCGHDIHTSIVLGTAFVLSRIKESIPGTVKFMFQHAEECSPHGGAKLMIEEGILHNPTVDEAYAFHISSGKVGTVEFKPGVATSKSDRFKIEIKGKSSHGSLPHEGNDAIVVASNIISSIQTIVSRNLSYKEKAIITIGTIQGGKRYNVIPDLVTLEGTIRTFSDKTYNTIKNRLQNIVSTIAISYDCEGILTYIDGYDFIYNNKILSNYAQTSLANILGKDGIIISNDPITAGEDFSFISKKVPSLFMWLGAEDETNKGQCILHSPKFIASESCIKEGIKILCQVALDRAK